MYIENELKKMAKIIADLHVQKAALLFYYDADAKKRREMAMQHCIDNSILESFEKEELAVLNAKIKTIDADLNAVPGLLKQFPDLSSYLDVYMPKC